MDASDADALGSQRATVDLILSTLNVSFDLESYLTMLKPDGQFCFAFCRMSMSCRRITQSLTSITSRCCGGEAVHAAYDVMRRCASLSTSLCAPTE